MASPRAFDIFNPDPNNIEIKKENAYGKHSMFRRLGNRYLISGVDRIVAKSTLSHSTSAVRRR